MANIEEANEIIAEEKLMEKITRIRGRDQIQANP
jgi:hypothetical protein